MVETPKAKTVEEYLNEVSYADDDKYIPSEFALKFVNFIKLVNGAQGEANKTPVLHYRMLDKAVANSGKDLINLVHRGAAKTTLLAEYLFLYIAVFGELDGFGKVPFAIYVSDSIDNGVKNMRKNLEFRRENSEFLMEWLPNVRFTDITWELTNKAGITTVIKGYGAKALSLDSELFTESGKTTIGACRVGDRIFGADGKLTTITAKSEVFHKPMYRITLADGRSIKVSEDHLNPVVINTNPNNTVRWEDKVLTTTELLKQPLTHTKKGNLKHKGISTKNLVFVKNIEPIQYATKQLPIDPYALGVILGDGRIRKDCGSVELTCHSDELEHYHNSIPYEFGALYRDSRSNAVTQSIRGLGKQLVEMELNVRGELKFIPDEYMYGDIQQRLSLLQGLLDTDGTISTTGRISFTSSSQQLCEDVSCLVRSLGGTASKLQKHKHAEAFRIEIWISYNPFKLSRKANRFIPKTKNVAVVSIDRISDEPSQCIAVDNYERQFITECYFRTHNTGVRGAKAMGKRPVLAVLDDLISDEDARSATVIASVEDTVYKAVDYALDPTRRKIIWSGTPFNAKDPLYKAVESGAWEVNVYPVCEQFPCTRKEFRGSWEDRFGYDFVKAQYDKALASGKVDTFNQELMLRIMSEEDRIIEDGDIQWYSRRDLIRNRNNYNFYITTDFATSEKTSADFSVISVWALNNKGYWYYVDGICKRQLLDQSIKDLFRLVQIYNPLSVGIEVTGQQQGFISWIQQEMMDKNTFFNLASSGNGSAAGIRPSSQKFTRFMSVLPWFKQKLFYFPEEMRNDPPMVEGINELTLVAKGGFKSKHDDFIDTISMLSMMDTWRPSASMDFQYNDKSGLWEDVEDDSPSSIGSYIV